jgi:ankyrin repeat protein
MFTSLESSSGEPQRTPNIRAALSYAIEHDNVEEVRTLLRDFHTDSISTENEIHRTLSLAISCGRTQIVEILLQRDDVNPGFEDKNGRGPLAAAAVSGFVAIVKLLIEKGGANPNHKDCGGRTPLMWAITKLGFTVKDLRSEYFPDHWSTVQFLLNCDTIDVNARDSHGRTALYFAAMIGNRMCVHSLLTQHSIQPHITDDHGRTALSWAAEMGHTDVTSLLLSIRLDEAFYLGLKDNTGRTPLSWATTFRPGGKISISEDHRNCGVLKLLLEFAENDSANKPILDSDHQDRSALSFAVVNTWTDNDVLSKAVRLLLRSDSSQLDSMDQEGRTILSRAAECGRRGVMEQLLQCEGLNLNAKDRDGRTPLSVAAANGRCTMVEMILARSGVDSTMIDLNLEDEQQHRTALHFAAEAGHESIVRSLLACKDINTECLDISGHTPLALAALKHHRGIVRLLTEDKAIIQQLAREEGNLSYIRSLLKTGCDADSKDSYGHTPLHVATIWNQPRVVEELLRWDPAIDLEDASGLTPLRIAISTRCKDIVSMLLNHSASTIGVSPKDWYHVYDRQASHALLHFSQNLSAEKSVHLVSNGVGRLKLQPETDRHLV